MSEKALEQFTEYFVRNYPGPDTVIFDPKWHAQKIFRAALSALTNTSGDDEAPVACEVKKDLYESLKELLDMLRREAPGTSLNNHRFDALGIKAYAALRKAESEKTIYWEGSEDDQERELDRACEARCNQDGQEDCPRPEHYCTECEMDMAFALRFPKDAAARPQSTADETSAPEAWVIRCKGWGEELRFTEDGAKELAAKLEAMVGNKKATITPLYARPQSAAVRDGWQPIETAPKDGSRILISHKYGLKIAWWGAAAYNRKTKSYNSGWTDGGNYGFVATHWMPLPVAPALHSTQEG
jgi:hypothetical protein